MNLVKCYVLLNKLNYYYYFNNLVIIIIIDITFLS